MPYTGALKVAHVDPAQKNPCNILKPHVMSYLKKLGKHKQIHVFLKNKLRAANTAV